jgi:ABC-type nitrate/sulfonate/bicarbonate transport system permease component
MSRLELNPRQAAYAGLELVGGLAVLGGLWIYTESAHSFYVTPLPTVISVFRETWLFADFGGDLAPSLERLAYGYVLAVVAGVGLGLLLASSRSVRLAADPVVSFLRSLPPPALIPAFQVLFGIGTTAKAMVIFFVCIWPILLNTMDGVAELDQTLIDTTRSCKIAGLDRFRLITLPAIAPRIAAGMRVSLSIAVLILIVSEMLASTNGIGHYVMVQEGTFSIPQMWAGTLLLGLLGFLLNGAFSIGERRILRWHYAQREAQ